MNRQLDEKFMHRAIELSKLAKDLVEDNPSVGCVIAKNDLILGEGGVLY